ncbi:hypothetical protein SPLA10_PHROGS00169 [Salmonella phage SPLA10]|nr:hypothetical protein SPLA10_PHROGS00169 [Salmonella phage SPLA10]
MLAWLKKLLRNPVVTDRCTMTHLSTELIILEQELEEHGISIDCDLLEEMEILRRRIEEFRNTNLLNC